MPGGSAGKIIDPDVVKSIIGTADLREGICSRRDPEIWSGEWCSQPGQGEKAKQIRTNNRARAVALCNMCPVLAQCEQQLQAFEAAGCRVIGIMAGRAWETGKSEFARAYGHSEDEPCMSCGRIMHQRPRQGVVPDLPDGHAWFRGQHLCRRCYARDVEGPKRRARRAQRKQGAAA